MAEPDRRAMDSSYMTDRMVADRCLRMYRNAQWKRLYEFCEREPRSRAWMIQRIAHSHGVDAGDARVAELYMRLEQGLTPRVHISTVVPGAVVHPEDLVEIIEEIPDSMVEEEVDLSDPVQAAPAHPAAPPRLPDAFIMARDDGDFPAAGRHLLAHVQTLPAQGPMPIMAVEFREVAAELARLGEFGLLVELCAALPDRVTASAIKDLGDKVRMGAWLHAPVLMLRDAAQAKKGRSATKKAEEAVMVAARRLAGEDERKS